MCFPFISPTSHPFRTLTSCFFVSCTYSPRLSPPPPLSPLLIMHCQYQWWIQGRVGPPYFYTKVRPRGLENFLEPPPPSQGLDDQPPPPLISRYGSSTEYQQCLEWNWLVIGYDSFKSVYSSNNNCLCFPIGLDIKCNKNNTVF